MLFSRLRACIIATLVIYGALVATHEGEFWPFSTYQMFSQGGLPWDKPVLLELDAEACKTSEFSSLEELNEFGVALNPYGIDHRDFSNFARHLSNPGEEELLALRSLLQPVIDGNEGLCITAIYAETSGSDINLTFTPAMYLSRDETILLREAGRHE